MKTRLKFQLKVLTNNRMIKTLSPTRKSKISHNLELNNFKSAYLKVTYQPGVHNDGTFENKEDLLKALAAWTEPSLLAYIEEGDWE